MGHLCGAAGLDRDLGHPIANRPVDRGGGQGHIKGHVVVVGGQGFEIGADLVAHIAAAGGAVGAHDHRIHLAVLHQMAAGVVHDHGVGHALLSQLVGRERGALVAGAGLVHPHMDFQPSAVGLIDRRQGRAPVHRGQPAGVAVGEHIEPGVGPGRRQLPEDRQPVIADGLAHGHVLIGDRRGLRLGRLGPLGRRQRLHLGPHPLQGPVQVDRRGPGGIELLKGRRQGAIAGVGLQGQHQPIGTGHADQRRSAHHHRAYRICRVSTVAQGARRELVGQQGLIDNANRVGARMPIRLQPDRAPGLAVDVHGCGSGPSLLLIISGGGELGQISARTSSRTILERTVSQYVQLVQIPAACRQHNHTLLPTQIGR